MKTTVKTFDPTKPVQTRDGRKARIICTDANVNGSYSLSKYPMIALVFDERNREIIKYYTKNGCFCGAAQHIDDLINIPEKKTLDVWVNVYDDCGEITMTHLTKEKANIAAAVNRIACLHIVKEYEVGEGIS